jgi:hypothetical protein
VFYFWGGRGGGRISVPNITFSQLSANLNALLNNNTHSKHTPPPHPHRHREKTASEERAKEEKLIAQFLAKCAEDDAKDARARRAREEAVARYKAEVAQQRDVRAALFEALEELVARDGAHARAEDAVAGVSERLSALLAQQAALYRGYAGDVEALEAKVAAAEAAAVTAGDAAAAARAKAAAFDALTAALGAPPDPMEARVRSTTTCTRCLHFRRCRRCPPFRAWTCPPGWAPRRSPTGSCSPACWWARIPAAHTTPPTRQSLRRC